MKLYSPTIAELDPDWLATLRQGKRRRRVSLRVFLLCLCCGMLASAGATTVWYDAMRSPHHLSHREAIDAASDALATPRTRRRATDRVYEIGRTCVQALQALEADPTEVGGEAQRCIDRLRTLIQ